jgi:hypothetical protein
LRPGYESCSAFGGDDRRDGERTLHVCCVAKGLVGAGGVRVSDCETLISGIGRKSVGAQPVVTDSESWSSQTKIFPVTYQLLAAPFLAEVGMIKAAGSTVSWLVKKAAVRVVLKAPVYVLSIRFPRSKISF